MKYDTAPAFDRDFAAMPRAHRRMFMEVVRQHFLPAIAAGAFTGEPPWPARLRIHRLSGSGIYSITWSFTGPDGRATFHLERQGAETILMWRRVGNHGIYTNP